MSGFRVMPKCMAGPFPAGGSKGKELKGGSVA
jgi:hypothetical protein